MLNSPIHTHQENGILEVKINRPKANAIDLKTSQLLGEVFGLQSSDGQRSRRAVHALQVERGRDFHEEANGNAGTRADVLEALD